MSWNDLPAELKMKCIENLDFKSRTSLRCSSRIERKLVDAVKYRFTKVTCAIFPKYSDFDVIASNCRPDRSEMFYVEFKKGFYKKPDCTTYLSDNPKTFNKVVDFMKLVLNAKIDELKVAVHPDDKDDKDQRLLAELVANGPPLRVTELAVELTPPMELKTAVLRQCEEKALAELVVDKMEGVELTAELVELCLKANNVTFKEGWKVKAHTVIEIAKKWAETGEDADREVVLAKCRPGFFAELAKGLEAKILERDVHSLRVETANPTKHIWIFEHGDTIHVFNVPEELHEQEMEQLEGAERLERLQNIDDMLEMINLWAGGDADRQVRQLMDAINSMNF